MFRSGDPGGRTYMCLEATTAPTTSTTAATATDRSNTNTEERNSDSSIVCGGRCICRGGYSGHYCHIPPPKTDNILG